MFISKLIITENGHTVINLCDKKNKDAKKTIDADEPSLSNFNLILGENGVGKSRYLKYLQDIFLYIESLKSATKNYTLKFDFEIEYLVNNNVYHIEKKQRDTFVDKDGIEISFDSLLLPSNLIAVSFMVGDKFLFSKNDYGMYKYIGVRAAHNNTYTSTIFRKFADNLLLSIQNDRTDTIFKILKYLGFDDYLLVIYTNQHEKDSSQNNSSYKTLKINTFSKADTKSEIYKHDAKITNVVVKNNDNPIEFLKLSSGEMHLLFALVGILAYIQDDSLILIDEPEISLHPEWQIKYISQLNSIFSKYKCCDFVIASHSHYLVSDLPITNSSVVVFRKNNTDYCCIDTEIIPYSTSAWSAEKYYLQCIWDENIKKLLF